MTEYKHQYQVTLIRLVPEYRLTEDEKIYIQEKFTLWTSDNARSRYNQQFHLQGDVAYAVIVEEEEYYKIILDRRNY